MTIDVTRAAVLWRRFFRPGPKRGPDPDGVPLGTSDRGQPVVWPAATPERASHGQVLAGSGAGKTVLLNVTALGEIIQDCARPPDERMAIVAVDAKGDMNAGLLQGIAAECPERLSDVRYLGPFAAGGGFPFNLAKLELGTVSSDVWAVVLSGLVGLLSTSVGEQKHLGTGQRQQDVLQHLILAVCECPHPRVSLLWALEALMSGERGTKALAGLTTSTRARQFLLATDLGDDLRASCAARLRSAFALTSGLARMSSAPGCIDFGELTAPGRITLACFGGAPFQALTTFYANAFTRIVVDRLYQRTTPWKGHAARLWLDEAQILAPVLTDVAERILTTGRSFQISAVIASQGTALLKAAGGETLLRVLMTNTNFKLVGRLAAPDAELLARERAPGPGVETTLSEVRSGFVGAVTNLRDREFLRIVPGEATRFRTRDVDLHAWADAADARGPELDMIRSRLTMRTDEAPPMTLSEAAASSVAEPTDKPRRGRGTKASVAAEAHDDAARPPPKAPRSKWG